MAGGGPTATRRVTRQAVAAALTLLSSVVVLVPGAPVDAQAAATITVNSTGDNPDANPGDGRCRTTAGRCSLRAAIDEANARPGPDRITFAIDGSGVHTIAIADTLTLNDPTGGTTIDGYTQTGARPNTRAGGSDAAIRIQVTTTSTPNPMLLIESAENTIRGLALWGNGPRIELRGEGADGNVIAGNFIGTDATGRRTSDLPPGATNDFRLAFAGVALNLGPDRNVIGGPDRADRNVISGNGQFGIRINHGETSENVIENNVIGLTPDTRLSNPQRIGIDLQWWTWGNYVTGNVISGNTGQAIDLSHSAVGNVVIDNRMGTGAGGNGGNAETANRHGVTFKDNAVDNYVVDNIIGNSTSDGIWHRHNYTGANTVVGNRIGVGRRGADIGNVGYGMTLRGHDDTYHGNLIANNDAGGIFITDTTPPPSPSTNFPPEQTLGNRIHQTSFYNTPFPFIDIEDVGQNTNDRGDTDDGAHRLLNHATITGVGPGQVFGRACAGCTIEAYVSGVVTDDGQLDPAAQARGKGAGWIGRAQANAQGRFSLAEDRIRAGKDLMLVVIDGDGNTSEFSPRRRVPSAFQGSGTNARASLGAVERPTVPGRPDPHVGSGFDCRLQGSTLAWDDAGAGEYYVFFTVNGTEGYIGPVRGTSVAAPPADSYRVEHWVSGFATNATCPGDGVPTFRCTHQAGTLSWTDAGASEYYAFFTVNGTEGYIGPVRGTSVAAPPADSYRVEHWALGPVTNATCPR